MDKTNSYHGVLTLSQQQKATDNHTNGTTTPRGPGRPPLHDASVEDQADTEDPCRKQNRVQRIGAQFAVQSICTYFGAELQSKVGTFWSIIMDTIRITDIDISHLHAQGPNHKPINYDLANELMICLQLIECSAPYIHADVIDQVFELLPKLCLLLKHPLKAVSIVDISFNFSVYLLMKMFDCLFQTDTSHGCTLFGSISHDQFITCNGLGDSRVHTNVANN